MQANPTVALSPTEIRLAALVATERQLSMANVPNRYGPVDNPWATHFTGAAAELAFAKFSGRYWNPSVGELGTGDINIIEVRATLRHDGHLILHHKDPDTAPAVLVTGAPPLLTLRGFIIAAHGKLPRFWRTSTGRPAFFVPQSELTHISKIPNQTYFDFEA